MLNLAKNRTCVSDGCNCEHGQEHTDGPTEIISQEHGDGPGVETGITQIQEDERVGGSNGTGWNSPDVSTRGPAAPEVSSSVKAGPKTHRADELVELEDRYVLSNDGETVGHQHFGASSDGLPRAAEDGRLGEELLTQDVIEDNPPLPKHTVTGEETQRSVRKSRSKRRKTSPVMLGEKTQTTVRL